MEKHNHATSSEVKLDYGLPPGEISEVQTGDDLTVSPSESREVLRRIDLCVIPLMGFCYLLQFMDKLALSYAALLGLLDDLNLHGTQYSWCSAIFYFGYLAWSWPSSYVIVRFPSGKYLAVTVCLWGGILMCHGAVHSFGGLMAARFFLGVGEAAIAPGFSLIISMFYTRKEQPLRQGAWFVGNSFASIFGGLVAYGIGEIQMPAIAHWRLLFLILGSITAAYALLLYLFLPDAPDKAVFLDEKQQQVALKRTIENKTGFKDNDDFVPAQVIDALTDPQLWPLVLYTISVNLANGGLTSFGALVIKGFGFSTLKTLLVQMSQGATQLVFILLTSTLATLLPSARLVLMIMNTLIAMAGLIMVYECKSRAARMGGLCLGSVFVANIPLSLSLISSNVGGFTKRSVTSSTLFVAYCIGNIVGPQFFQSSQAPKYPTGIKAALSGLALGAWFLACLLAYYVWENARRNKRHGPSQRLSGSDALREDLSGKTDRQLPDFRYVI
ncbi:MFS transporter, ACS family, allantoate permease [Fonsecaea erecta]|uniref:MFS transporter, ACS family, allantoate permease n=1 Tax=Fonsecaea erecta TaxID=1367422 RepID=A0A178ZZW7_9EURO|nr:MFS transporter, ACS family, allantoate permease [Fonsecaea erecta]OAP65297.1 MFS transporter, ACS family, allantoate permease [Fonsecaea erecta]